MKLRLTRKFSFEMAHALPMYDGKCRNIHGHSYKLYVTVEAGNPNVDSGMVLDFNRLKQIVEEHILQPFDHALVLPRLQHDLSPDFNGYGAKLIITPFQPTTENLLIHFSEILSDKIPAPAKIHSLKLFETESSCAELILTD